MRRGLLAVALLLALGAAGPAKADVLVQAAPVKDVRTCIRDAGNDQLAVGGTFTSRPPAVLIDLLGTSDLQRVAQARLGPLLSCPEVGSGGGVTVIAGLSFSNSSNAVTVQASVRDGGRPGFGETTAIDELGGDPTALATAVGPRGDAVVAWSETTGSFDGPRKVRVLAARRSPGGAWGAAEEVVPQRDIGEVSLGTVDVAAGIDAAGRVTVAAVLPAPGNADDPPFVSAGRIEVATAAPGAPFAATQRLAPGLPTAESLSLAVTPSGRALLVAPGTGVVLAWERGPEEGAFGAAATIGEAFEEAAFGIDATLREDGAAVLAYRFLAGSGRSTREGVSVARRLPGAAFGRPERVWSRAAPRADDGGGSGEVSVGLSAEAGSPFDTPGVRVALGGDGRLSVAAGVLRRGPGGDRTTAPLVVRGALEGALTATLAGSPCRSVIGTAATISSDGTPAAAWTDNATRGIGEVFEEPIGAGRVHIVRDGGAAPPASQAPRVRVLVPRGRPSLYGGDPVPVRFTCDSPCDVRALVTGRANPRAATGAALPRGGRGRVELTATNEAPLVPRRGTVPVTIHACSPDGTATSTATARLRLQRRRPPPLAVPEDVRARRSGDDVIVTWRTEIPARRVSFAVFGTSTRRPDFDDRVPFELVEGRGRRRFRQRLTPTGGFRIREVTVGAFPQDPPFDRGQREVVVRVSG